MVDSLTNLLIYGKLVSEVRAIHTLICHSFLINGLCIDKLMIHHTI